jgi:hypothetical protein
MRIKIFIFLSIFIFISGCRDYLNDLNTNAPPALFTDAISYPLNDSITVVLENNSTKAIYANEIINTVEQNTGGNWIFYASLSCYNCYEFSVLKNQTRSIKSKPVHDTGVFRFICLYSSNAGTSEEQKIKLYSNEFTVY